MSMKNDLAFILDLDLFLWEHQSTYNPNIPLRDLMYLAKEYEKYIKEKRNFFILQQTAENSRTAVYRILQREP